MRQDRHKCPIPRRSRSPRRKISPSLHRPRLLRRHRVRRRRRRRAPRRRRHHQVRRLQACSSRCTWTTRTPAGGTVTVAIGHARHAATARRAGTAHAAIAPPHVTAAARSRMIHEMAIGTLTDAGGHGPPLSCRARTRAETAMGGDHPTAAARARARPRRNQGRESRCGICRGKFRSSFTQVSRESRTSLPIFSVSHTCHTLPFSPYISPTLSRFVGKICHKGRRCRCL